MAPERRLTLSASSIIQPKRCRSSRAASAIVRPGPHFHDNHYLVLHAEGDKVGPIQLEEHISHPGARWGWYVNGEVVAGQVTATGPVVTRDEAKAELGRNGGSGWNSTACSKVTGRLRLVWARRGTVPRRKR